jgi:SHS family lactate transporter-like MFS transporter
MAIFDDLKLLTRPQWNAVIASYLGWTLDAFDFFILVFVLGDIAKEFNVPNSAVADTLFWTLFMRPFGAFIFGWVADRWGRRPTLMVDVLFYSVVEFLCGFAPSLTVLFLLRALYGIAMGGEWGVGASLTMETIPARSRGIVSGILQAGYPSGYLLAAILFATLHNVLGWRGMFMVGVLPALLVLFIRRNVEESPSWGQMEHKKGQFWQTLKVHWPLAVFVILLMTVFNSFSHGTQDLYPSLFLKGQHQFSDATVGTIAIVYNIGAILGGLTFGSISQRVGRKWAIIAAGILTLPIIPLWAFSKSPVLLGLGAFLIQFFVQGAWGIVPAHLNELSPDEVRATFPGFTYQLGNLFASKNGNIQAALAERWGNNVGLSLTVTVAIISVALIIITAFSPEKRDVKFGEKPAPS